MKTILLALLATLPPMAFSQPGGRSEARPTTRFKNMREAIDALKSTKDVRDADEIRTNLDNVPVSDHEDLMALYDQARKEEDALPLTAEDKVYDEHARYAGALASRLKSVTDPVLSDDIASLIDKEYQDAKAEARLPLPKLTTRSHMKSALRYERVNALITAAGDGKNGKARAALWKIIDLDKDDHLGRGAANALGKIGNPDDLDRLVGMIKQDPKLLLPLGSFGSAAISRVMRDVDDPSTPKDAKGRLAGVIEQAGSHDAIPTLMPLLQHPNDDVVRHAAAALEKALRPGDEQVIRQMLKDQKWNVRTCAIIAVGQQAWRDDYYQLLVDVLRSDADDNNRAMAAHYLGEHRVQGAVTALRDALQDKSGSVRTDAAAALKKIPGQK